MRPCVWGSGPFPVATCFSSQSRLGLNQTSLRIAMQAGGRSPAARCCCVRSPRPGAGSVLRLTLRPYGRQCTGLGCCLLALIEGESHNQGADPGVAEHQGPLAPSSRG